MIEAIRAIHNFYEHYNLEKFYEEMIGSGMYAGTEEEAASLLKMHKKQAEVAFDYVLLNFKEQLDTASDNIKQHMGMH